MLGIGRRQLREDAHFVAIEVDGDHAAAIGIEIGEGSSFFKHGGFQCAGRAGREALDNVPDGSHDQFFQSHRPHQRETASPRLHWQPGGSQQASGTGAHGEGEEHTGRKPTEQGVFEIGFAAVDVAVAASHAMRVVPMYGTTMGMRIGGPCSGGGRIAMMRRRRMVAEAVSVTVQGVGMPVERAMTIMDFEAVSVARGMAVSFMVSAYDTQGGHEG